jgi:hypothetical protein
LSRIVDVDEAGESAYKEEAMVMDLFSLSLIFYVVRFVIVSQSTPGWMRNGMSVGIRKERVDGNNITPWERGK